METLKLRNNNTEKSIILDLVSIFKIHVDARSIKIQYIDGSVELFDPNRYSLEFQ